MTPERELTPRPPHRVPEVLLVRNDESDDLNYGGIDVLIRDDSEAWLCVAETESPYKAATIAAGLLDGEFPTLRFS